LEKRRTREKKNLKKFKKETFVTKNKERIGEICDMIEIDSEEKTGVKMDTSWFPLKDLKFFGAMEK